MHAELKVKVNTVMQKDFPQGDALDLHTKPEGLVDLVVK